MIKDKALKMAIELLEKDLLDIAIEMKDEVVSKSWSDLRMVKYYDQIIEYTKQTIQDCKEALEQPAPPEKTTSLEDVIKEFEKDPEMKALLDLARKQVKGMELEQPAQEPVEVYGILDDGDYVSVEATKEGAIKQCDFMNKHDCNCTYKPLYTHPHQWQGLTDDEILKASSYIDMLGNIDDDDVIKFAIAIEKALKDKNT